VLAVLTSDIRIDYGIFSHSGSFVTTSATAAVPTADGSVKTISDFRPSATPRPVVSGTPPVGTELVGRNTRAGINRDIELRDGAGDLRADMHILTAADHGAGLDQQGRREAKVPDSNAASIRAVDAILD
jgi:hypothetical protein